MFKWLMSLFGRKPASEPDLVVVKLPERGGEKPIPSSAERVVPAETSAAEEKPAAELHAAPPQPPQPGRDEEMCAFLGDMVMGSRKIELQGLAPDDRLFVSGVLKRVREQKLEVPVLPQAALQISQLLANPNSDARAFAKVLEADPALSVDVLRIANSAYYGFNQRTNSVRDAVVRIGLTQLRGLIIVTHLQGKILKSGVFRIEAEWMMELSMAMAQLAQGFAAELGIGKDEAFTRGVLSHVEHFIIMGCVADISRGQKKRVQPSRGALLDTIQLCGTKVRVLAGQQWDLKGMMDWDEAGDSVSSRYVQLRKALVADWRGEMTLPPVDGVEPARLASALQRLRRDSGVRQDTRSQN